MGDNFTLSLVDSVLLKQNLLCKRGNRTDQKFVFTKKEANKYLMLSPNLKVQRYSVYVAHIFLEDIELGLGSLMSLSFRSS